MVASADIVVDALFGIGLKLPLRSDAAKLLAALTKLLMIINCLNTRSITINPANPAQIVSYPKPYVIAVDALAAQL